MRSPGFHRGASGAVAGRSGNLRDPWVTSNRSDLVFIFSAYWASELRLGLGEKQVVELMALLYGCVYEDPRVVGSTTKVKHKYHSSLLLSKFGDELALC